VFWPPWPRSCSGVRDIAVVAGHQLSAHSGCHDLISSHFLLPTSSGIGPSPWRFPGPGPSCSCSCKPVRCVALRLRGYEHSHMAHMAEIPARQHPQRSALSDARALPLPGDLQLLQLQELLCDTTHMGGGWHAGVHQLPACRSLRIAVVVAHHAVCHRGQRFRFR
jgi:hypothetical protein